MKVLLLSIKTGYGHHRTAQALLDYLGRNDVECKMVDAYEYINPVLSQGVSLGYDFSTQITPAIYGKLYHWAERHSKNYVRERFSVQSLVTSALSKKLIKLLDEYSPDVVISTHIFASQIVTILKQKKIISSKTIGIVTDFTIHPFWEESELDYYVVASEQLSNQLNRKGINSDKMLPFGIPINEKFSKCLDKQEARTLLGIDDKKTILVMMGSMGYGNVIKSIRAIDKLGGDFQIICVCGFNTKMKSRIDTVRWNKKVYNYGFVENVDLLMDASDCIITKPGGLTTSEALSKGLPTILMNPIPGQEDRNAEFLLNNGVAMMVTKTFPIDEAVFQMFSNDWRLSQLENCAKNIGKPNATKDLTEFILNIGENANAI